jgi:hypothetical protein
MTKQIPILNSRFGFGLQPGLPIRIRTPTRSPTRSHNVSILVLEDIVELLRSSAVAISTLSLITSGSDAEVGPLRRSKPEGEATSGGLH